MLRALILQCNDEYSREWVSVFESAGIEAVTVDSIEQANSALELDDWEFAVFEERLLSSEPELLRFGAARARNLGHRALISVATDPDVQMLAGAYSAGAVPVPRHLVAPTIRAILDRRVRTRHFTELVLDSGTQTAESAGRGSCKLAAGEWQVLTHLVAHEGRWCSASEIARVQFSRTDRAGIGLVWKYVSRLKKALSFLSDIIQSAPGTGYRVNPEARVSVLRPESPTAERS